MNFFEKQYNIMKESFQFLRWSTDKKGKQLRYLNTLIAVTRVYEKQVSLFGSQNEFELFHNLLVELEEYLKRYINEIDSSIHLYLFDNRYTYDEINFDIVAELIKNGQTVFESSSGEWREYNMLQDAATCNALLDRIRQIQNS